MTQPALKLATQVEAQEPPAGSEAGGAGAAGHTAAPGARRLAWLRGVVEGGVWAGMSGSARSVLVVILLHADAVRGQAWPSLARVSRLTGLARSSAVRGLRELEALGVLARSGGGGRSTAVYRLDEAFRTRTEDATPVPPVGLLRSHGRDGSGAVGGTSEVPRVGPRSESGNRQTTATGQAAPPTGCASGAAGGEAEEARALLVAEGFEPADAGSLALRGGLAQVRTAKANADFLEARRELRSGRRAYIAAAIRGKYRLDERIGRELERKAEKQRQRERAEEAARAAQVRRREVEASRESMRAAVEALSGAELARLAAEALAEMPPVMRGVLEDKSPLESQGWVAAIYRLLERERSAAR